MGSPATWRASTSANVGAWLSGTRTIGGPGDGIPPGTAGRFQVRVWDLSLATNAAAARLALGTLGYGGTDGGLYGESAVFSFTPVLEGTSLPYELRGFKLDYYPYGGLNASLPTIVKHPKPPFLNVLIGQNAQLSVSTWEPNPCTYQWSLNTSNILSDATNISFTLLNAEVLDTGFYACIVSNAAGSVTSAPAFINVVAGLGMDLVPAISLTGQVGFTYRLEYLTTFSPSGAWNPVANITMTNNPQLYIDVSAIGDRSRIYRMVQLP
jgi:hypothetical protein